jgi:hypothetical protein
MIFYGGAEPRLTSGGKAGVMESSSELALDLQDGPGGEAATPRVKNEVSCILLLARQPKALDAAGKSSNIGAYPTALPQLTTNQFKFLELSYDYSFPLGHDPAPFDVLPGGPVNDLISRVRATRGHSDQACAQVRRPGRREDRLNTYPGWL